MTNKFFLRECASNSKLGPTTTLTRIPTHTHTWSPRYSTDWFISASLTPRRFYSFNSHRYPVTQFRVHLHFWQPALVRSPTTKPSSPAGFSANGLHVHDSIPSVPPSFLLEREREREIVPNELCVRTYVHRACISPPVSVLISHQFLLWRTRGPGRQQAILVAASRCLDLEDVASALYSSRGSRGSPPLVLSPDIFLYLVVFHFPSSFLRFEVWWIRVTIVPQCVDVRSNE